MMNGRPEIVERRLIELLDSIEAEKFSKDWENIQMAKAMLVAPSTFKKGGHVFLFSFSGAMEPGVIERDELSIKIWPHKIQIRHEKVEYNSWEDIDNDKVYRYIFPSEKYTVEDFEKIMSDCGCHFSGPAHDVLDTSGYDGIYRVESGYKIESNLKL